MIQFGAQPARQGAVRGVSDTSARESHEVMDVRLAGEMVSRVHYQIAPQEGSSMVKSIEKVLTFFVVIILLLILLGILGPFIASSLQPASIGVSDIVHNAWAGIIHIVHAASGR